PVSCRFSCQRAQPVPHSFPTRRSSDLLEQPADDRLKSEWIFVAYFADSMPPDLLERRLRERVDWYRERLEAMEGCNQETLRDGERFVLDLGVAVYRAAARYIEEQGPSLVAASRRRTGTPEAAE